MELGPLLRRGGVVSAVVVRPLWVIMLVHVRNFNFHLRILYSYGNNVVSKYKWNPDCIIIMRKQ
jgi:hypothetical protein